MKQLLDQLRADPLRTSANIIFLIISCLLVASLLVQLSDKPAVQILLACMSVGLDIFRQYLISRAKSAKTVIMSIALWSAYAAHVSVVVLASASFALSEIDHKQTMADTQDIKRAQIIQQITSLENQITTLQTRQKELTNYNWLFRDIDKRIQTARKALTESVKALEEAALSPQNIGRSGFDAIGQIIHVPGSTLKVALIVILCAILELSLVMTSWHIEPAPVTKEAPTSARQYIRLNREKIKAYISAMTEDGTKKIRGNAATCEAAGLELAEGKTIRRLLETIKTESGQPLIFTSQGGAVYNQPPTDMIKMIEYI